MKGVPACKATILVVANDVRIGRNLPRCLEEHGYRVLEAATGRKGLAKAAESRPDIVLLDLALPDMDGMTVLKRLRKQSRVPILIVSECGLESTKISALDSGANDYIVRPFSVGELLARLRVVLRYPLLEKDQVIHYGRLSVDFSTHTVTVANQKVKLTPIEYSLLCLLAQHAGKVLTYPQIFRHIWGREEIDKSRELYVYLRRLREKLEHDPSRPALLMTIPSVGIQLTP